MKMNRAKRAIAFLIGLCFLFAVFPAYADTGTGISEPSRSGTTLAEEIPAPVTEFIADRFSVISDTVRSSLDGIAPEQEILLGNPYLVYRFGEYQDEVYYYPMIAAGRIRAVLGVIGTDLGYTYEISYNGGLLELLDETDYLNSDCIFYVADDELYYESENGASAKPSASAACATDQSLSAAEVSFAAMSFEEKQRALTDRLQSLRSVDTQNFAVHEPENIKYGAMKEITLRNKRSQYGYEMCWACVVATIVNTLNWTSYTGYDVCNRMGIGFNAGAEVEEIKTAFSYYGVDYKKTADALGWSEITQNIDAGYPIAMLMVPYYAPTSPIGHSVTLYGYDSGNHNIRIWNSQSIDPDDPYREGFQKDIDYYHQKIDLTPPETPNASYIVLSDDRGSVFLWNQTLSKYQ